MFDDVSIYPWAVSVIARKLTGNCEVNGVERCDFSSVVNIITSYIAESKKPNQLDLMLLLFESFMRDDASIAFDFDNGKICRWINGNAKVSPQITGYYADENNKHTMAKDIKKNILPIMYDADMAVTELHNLIQNDMTVSEKKKVDNNRKLIKTVNLDVETKEFDQLINTLETQVDMFDGYVESQNTWNGTYYDYHHGRRLLSQRQQQRILKLMASYGYADNLQFDGYCTVTDF